MIIPDLNTTERRILDQIQAGFPLESEPYKVLGNTLELNSSEMLEHIRQLKQTGYLRQICGIFDGKRLGYHSALIALEIAPEKIENAVKIINAHPGVSHNYARNHIFNLWFTLAVPTQQQLQSHAQRIKELSECKRMLILPAITTYKIGVRFSMIDSQEKNNNYQTPNVVIPEKEITMEDIPFIQILQEDFPENEKPYEVMAKQLGITEENLLQKIHEYLKWGYIRRVAGLLHHRKAGYTANAMVVWQIPPNECDAIGKIFATRNFVTHCYQRREVPEFPYSLYTMVHAQTQEECEERIQWLQQDAPTYPHQTIYSTQEFKKRRVLYYSPILTDWENQYGIR